MSKVLSLLIMTIAVGSWAQSRNGRIPSNKLKQFIADEMKRVEEEYARGKSTESAFMDIFGLFNNAERKLEQRTLQAVNPMSGEYLRVGLRAVVRFPRAEDRGDYAERVFLLGKIKHHLDILETPQVISNSYLTYDLVLTKSILDLTMVYPRSHERGEMIFPIMGTKQFFIYANEVLTHLIKAKQLSKNQEDQKLVCLAHHAARMSDNPLVNSNEDLAAMRDNLLLVLIENCNTPSREDSQRFNFEHFFYELRAFVANIENKNTQEPR